MLNVQLLSPQNEVRIAERLASEIRSGWPDPPVFLISKPYMQGRNYEIALPIFVARHLSLALDR